MLDLSRNHESQKLTEAIEPSSRSASGARPRLLALAAWILLALICVLVQWKSGAYTADVAGHPDEPAHVVTGLLVHDYIRNLFAAPNPLWPRRPLPFAEVYYAHYPKVAFGHWPPLFYALQAVWMFAFGRSKSALLVLILATMAVAAGLTFQAIRRFAGDVTAFLISATFLLLPVSQQYLFAVMPGALLVLFSCAAMIAGGVALAGRRRYWIIFGMLALAAIFTHPRAFALLFAPPIALLLARKISLFRRWAFWAVAGLIGLPLVVWLLSIHQTLPLTIGAATASAASFPLYVFRSLGPALFLLVILGALAPHARRDPRLTFLTAVILGNWAFFTLAIVPWEDRYLATALPACIVLAAYGLFVLAGRVSPALPLRRDVAVALLAATAFVATLPYVLPLRHKPNVSYEALVHQILGSEDGKKTVYLIAGDQNHEGAFIAGMDLQERSGKHFVLRSTKALIRSDWLMYNVAPVFKNVSEMAAFLQSSWISLVVVQDGPVRPDVEMLRHALRESNWQELPAPTGTSMYRRTTPLPPGPMKIKIDMQNSLNRPIEITQ